jgi:hypothetical protein
MQRVDVAGSAEIDIINHLDTISAKKVKYDTIVSTAAELLMDIHNPCLILEERDKKDNSIVTSWDIVMKTVRPDASTISVIGL